VAIGSLICFLFTVSIRYMYQSGKIKQLEWDMSTITAGDYTVEINITRNSYDNWKNDHYYHHLESSDPAEQKSPALYLKEHIIPLIEEAVSK